MPRASRPWVSIARPAAITLLVVASAGVIPLTSAVAAHGAETAHTSCEESACVVTLATPGITLASVSCPSAHRCVAVGSEGTGADALPVSATETDGVWHAEVLAASGAAGADFANVSCPTTALCVAVGSVNWGAPSYFQSTVLADDIAGKWSVVDGSQIFGWEGFSSVSCHAATSCTAVGGESPDGSFVTAAIYDTEAKGWWPTPSLFTPTSQVDAPLLGISCPTNTQCTAVGQHVNGQPMVAADAQGSWSASTVAMRGPATEGVLTAVSCPSPTSCTAVGYTEPDASDLASGNEPMYATDVNGQWSAATVLTAPDGTGTFTSVSCTSAEDCTAVGETRATSTAPSQPMYAVETGGVWSAPRVIVVPVLGGAFTGVDCTSARSCTAVGDDGAGYPIYPTESAGVWPSVPSPPRRVRVAAGSTTLRISWTEPAANGGSRITATTAVASAGSHAFTCSTTGTSCTVRGLANGTTYAVTVSSRNATGESAASTAVSATPRA